MDQTNDDQVQTAYLKTAEYQANLLTLYNLMRDLNEQNYDYSLNQFKQIHNYIEILVQEICNQPINWFYRTKSKKYLNFLADIRKNIDMEDNLIIKIKHDFQAKRQECLDLVSVFDIPDELRYHILSRVLCDILVAYRYDQPQYANHHQKVQQLSNLLTKNGNQVEGFDKILNQELPIHAIINLDFNQIIQLQYLSNNKSLSKMIEYYVPLQFETCEDDIKLELQGCLNQLGDLNAYLLNKLILVRYVIIKNRPNLCQWLYETIIDRLIIGQEGGYNLLQSLCNNDELKKKHKIVFRDLVNKGFTQQIQNSIRTKNVEWLSLILIELWNRNLLNLGTKQSILQFLVKEYLIDKDIHIHQSLKNLEKLSDNAPKQKHIEIIQRYDNPAYLDIQEAINFNTIKFIIM